MISSMNTKIFLEDSINLKWKNKEKELLRGMDKNREITLFYGCFSYCLDFKLVEDGIKCH